MGFGESGEAPLPQAEAWRMDPLAPAKPSDRLHRLAMVAVFVMQHVFEERSRNPRQGQSRSDLDPTLWPSVAAEAQMGQAASGWVASPGHRDRREIGKPSAVNPLGQGLQERTGIGLAMRPDSTSPGSCAFRRRGRHAGGGSLQQVAERGSRTTTPAPAGPFRNRYRTVGIYEKLWVHPHNQPDRRMPPQAKQATSGAADFDGESR